MGVPAFPAITGNAWTATAGSQWGDAALAGRSGGSQVRDGSRRGTCTAPEGQCRGTGENRSQGQQDAGGSGGEVHRQAQQLLAGERHVSLVRDEVPGQSSDVAPDDGLVERSAVLEVMEQQDQPRPP